MTRLGALGPALLVQLSCAGRDHAPASNPVPWIPEGASSRADAGLDPQGGIEFSLTARPRAVSESLQAHYLAEHWQQLTRAGGYRWNLSRGGGVLLVPGRPNEPRLYWRGEWQNDRGKTVSYALIADSGTEDQLCFIVGYTYWHADK